MEFTAILLAFAALLFFAWRSFEFVRRTVVIRVSLVIVIAACIAFFTALEHLLKHAYSLFKSKPFWILVDIGSTAIVVGFALSLLRLEALRQLLIGVAIVAAGMLFVEFSLLPTLVEISLQIRPYVGLIVVTIVAAIVRVNAGAIHIPLPGNFLLFRAPWLAQKEREEILLAVQQMSQQRIGALIVVAEDISNDEDADAFAFGGVEVDSQIQRDIILSIFYPGAPLHDGAVLIKNRRISRAAWFGRLSSSMQTEGLGSRHRAGLGITETSKCMAIIVSEQFGTISFARDGSFEFDVSIDHLESELGDLREGTRYSRKKLRKQENVLSQTDLIPRERRTSRFHTPRR